MERFRSGEQLLKKRFSNSGQRRCVLGLTTFAGLWHPGRILLRGG